LGLFSIYSDPKLGTVRHYVEDPYNQQAVDIFLLSEPVGGELTKSEESLDVAWFKMKKVIVTGILGQDGANMAEYLLDATDHEVIGVMRRSANPNYKNIKTIMSHPRFHLEFMELTDTASIDNLIKNEQPDYFINFAANSFVGISWEMPESVMDTNTLGVLRCLEAIRKFAPNCRFYSAGSSEEFGDVNYSPQDIDHPIKPRSPYGASKAAARHLVKVYRESYDIYAVHGILFNHEGPKRGEEFVTRKITSGVAKIKNQMRKEEEVTPIELGNLDAKRDWSDSRDFVKGVWIMLNQDEFRLKKTGEIKDYVLSSGNTHSVRDFVNMAFKYAGLSGKWYGSGKFEHFILDGKDAPMGVIIREKFYRPAEVDLLMGNSDPIREELGWQPEITLDKMIEDMVKEDLNACQEEKKA
jgi:GDPmannose 4,6-dehydratase